MREGVINDRRLLFCATLGMGIWGLVRGKSGVKPGGTRVQGTTELNGGGY
jgi:hypothetical protein